MKKLICIAALAMLVSGCATGYQRKSFTGGYSETKIQDDIYRVDFSGNAYAGRVRTQDFCLLRCAELTLENNYKYFVIIDANVSTATGSYTTPTTATTSGSVNTYGNYGTYQGTTNVHGGQTYVFSKPSACNMIKCFKEKPEGVNTMIYDAEQIARNIKESYKIK